MPSLTTGIFVGQRVHCRLTGLGDGIVFAMSCALPQHFRADVVFDNGIISRGVPYSIITGPQWDVLDRIETAERVAEALTDAAIIKAQQSVAADRRSAELHALRDSLSRDPRYASLETGDDRTSGRLAARNIRRVLAGAFPGARFSVRREDHGTVTICWSDGPTDAAVQAEVGRFRDGRFDPVEDLWRRDEREAWTLVFGGVEFLFTRRAMTAALYARAIDALWTTYPGELADVEKMSGDRFVARGSMLSVPGLEADLGVMIWRTASGLAA